jgi:hypothetical protein
LAETLASPNREVVIVPSARTAAAAVDKRDDPRPRPAERQQELPTDVVEEEHQIQNARYWILEMKVHFKF